jgi:membrane protein DedA with SNARE-associated domain
MRGAAANAGPGLLALCCAVWFYAAAPLVADPPDHNRPTAEQRHDRDDEHHRRREKPDRLADELTEGRVGKLIQRFSYAAIIGTLLLCGLGLPLPEEIPILTSGVLAQMGHMRPWPALTALMIGVMLGDSAMFLLGRSWGGHLFEHRFARRMLTVERQAKIAEYFAKYGALVIFVARFLPGLRAPLFLTAGSMKVRFITFFSMDGLAALLSVPISFWVAYYFTDRLTEVLDLSHKMLYWVLAGVVVLLIVGHLVWDRWRAARKLREQALAGEAQPAPPIIDVAVSDPTADP